MKTNDYKYPELTTENAASSYGIPVLVWDGIAHGPEDIIQSPNGRGEKAGVWVASNPHLFPADLAKKFTAHIGPPEILKWLARKTT